MLIIQGIIDIIQLENDLLIVTDEVVLLATFSQATDQ
jgi:hypothetical protein